MQKLAKIEEALYLLDKNETECKLCPRECGVNRKSGDKGFCHATIQASLSHALLISEKSLSLAALMIAQTKQGNPGRLDQARERYFSLDAT